VRVKLEPIDCGEVLDEIRDTLRPLAEKKGLQLKVHAPRLVVLNTDRRALSQILINLINNAVDAALVTGGRVRIRWKVEGQVFTLIVEDDGPGLPETINLFVPFFTTKPGGTGIGLVLSRQIAEAHGGTLTLANRHDATGCQATLTLPLRPA
jgi:signal transduction histidine kinase